MLSKGSKLYSILHGVCPRCQEGKMFKKPPYSLSSFDVMNDQCAQCGQSFEPEPDFYQGAMYVSYALSVGISFGIGMVMVFLFNINLWISAITFTAVLLLLLPVIYRVSRVIWLNLFVRYKPLRPGQTQS